MTICSFYVAATFFVKLSLLLIYLRLFKPNNTSKWLIYTGILIFGAFYASCIVAYCVLYLPIPKQAQDLIRQIGHLEESITKIVNLCIVQAVFGTASDIYMLIIPIYSIFQLQLPFRKKIGVSTIFLVGLMCVPTFSSRSRRLPKVSRYFRSTTNRWA